MEQASTEIRNSTSYKQIRKSLLSFIKPTCSSLHNFHDIRNPLCSCSLEPETTSHYLSSCHNFSSSRLALMNDLNLINPSISQLNKTTLANILLYSDSRKSTSANSKILQSTIRYIIICDLCIYIFVYIYIYTCAYVAS